MGGWKRATIPTSSPGGCCPATEEISCFATVFLSSKHSIFLNVLKIIFLLDRELD